MRRLPGPRGRAGVSSSPPARPCHRARSSGTGRGLHPALLASAVPSWNTRTCHHDPQQPRQQQLTGGMTPAAAAWRRAWAAPGAARCRCSASARPRRLEAAAQTRSPASAAQSSTRGLGGRALELQCCVCLHFELKNISKHREVTAEHCRSLPCILDGGCCSLDSEL